jgi:hypothetical protein
METAKWLGLCLGIVLVIGNWINIIRTLITPGAHKSRGLFLFTEIWRRSFNLIARRLPNYGAKHRFLSLQAPTLLLAVLAIWLFVFLIGFSLILIPIENTSFLKAVEIAGSSEFTLGFFAPQKNIPIFISLFAAVTGLVVVALEIGFWPALYSAYNRRERLVTLLEAKAGSPPWGPEILARHSMVFMLDSLEDFYKEWEIWAADISESHSTYSFLLQFRSPKALTSWVTALLAVLDSAALLLSLNPALSTAQTRLFLRMGFSALRNISTGVGISFNEDPLPTDRVELSYEEFLEGVSRLIERNFPITVDIELAWKHFKGWRVNYEETAYKLADYANAVAAPWSGPRISMNESEIAPVRILNRTPDNPEGR